MEQDLVTIRPDVEVRETHTGYVVLVADKAYKAKKPIATEFLDFSTVKRRERACAREVALNSRLAPQSYLGVGHWKAPAGGPAEPILVMNRYPDSRRLATLAKGDAAVFDQLAQIAEALANFHDSARQGRAVDAQGKPDAVSIRWQDNIAELETFPEAVAPPALLGQIDSLARQYIAGRGALFKRRRAEKRLVDGHGDLLADDIFCMPTGPVLLDCLDFDDRLRYVDRIDDAAFLAMDLEFLGRKDLADFFLDTYCRISADQAPGSLKHFYIAYRALVRAKVDCIRFGQHHHHEAVDASRHLTLVLEHLAAGTVRLALVGGAPGTGKTTLAHALAQRVGAEVISTDDVRSQLLRNGTVVGEPGVLDSGLYRPDRVASVYDEAIRRAGELLSGGRSVILDGTWRDSDRRRLAQSLATETASALIEIVCWASVDAAVARVAHRVAGASDATPNIARALAVRDDTWETAHPINTSQPLAECSDKAEVLWHKAN
ncbi:MAG: AAA family ATPase [Mycobacterium sp.]